MLIECDRIRAEDHELWMDLERADALHVIGKHRIQAAISAISEFRDAGPCWCGVSWGKDSVVVADLCCRVGGIPLVFVCTRRTTPYWHGVMSQFRSSWPDARITVIAEDEGDQWPHWGGGIGIADEMFGRRAVHGVRRQESSVRRLSAMVHGISTAHMCRPILNWSSDEVFAYLCQNDLPVHPNYAMLGGGRWPRDWIRVGSIGGPRGRGIGRDEWEREYYGDVLRRIEAESVKR